ncbi:hypothetical protein C8F01DRAFT_1250815 [Mycena amicta]|nr:hypothetical protein C8F01DRAFT_1250815 [Mycena amicta]
MNYKTAFGHEWDDPRVCGYLVASLAGVLLATFILAEFKFATEPILAVSMLAHRTPLFVAIHNFILSVLSLSIFFNTPLFFKAAVLRTSANAGAHLVPKLFAVAIGSLSAGYYMRQTGRYVYWKFQAIAGICIIATNIVLSTWNQDTPEWLLYATLMPSGFGFTSTLTTTLLALIASVSREDIPLATGLSQHEFYKVKNFSDEDATRTLRLLKPAACVIHGLDKLAAPLNGAARIVITANKGIKMDIAKDLDCADEYIELDRQNPDTQWAQLKKDNPYGFDIVVEKLANDSINYVCRGGTLMIYSVYENKALVHWPPSNIFGDEIWIIGSFSRKHTASRAVAYLNSGKAKVKGMVTDSFKLEDYQAALDNMNSRGALKICIKPN